MSLLPFVLVGCELLGTGASSTPASTVPSTPPSNVPSTTAPTVPSTATAPTDTGDTGVACVDGGDGAIELFEACVDGVCGAIYNNAAAFLAAAEAVLGAASCDAAADRCTWENGELEARVPHSGGQPDDQSDLFRIEWTLHTGSRQTISGLSVGADVDCFVAAHGPGTPTATGLRWSALLVDYPGLSGFEVEPATGTVQTLRMFWEWEE